MSADSEIVPVMLVTQAGSIDNPIVFDLTSVSDWNALGDEIRESFIAAAIPGFPGGHHGVDIRLSAMTRTELDQLPEHQGW